MDTAHRILDAAEALMQRDGYAGFSYQSLADAVGVKKASLYHHFPGKADLGRAVIEQYRIRMRAVAEQLGKVEGVDARSALRLYLAPILGIGRAEGEACLCAVLGGEFVSLPEGMQAEVRGFFDEHIAFLEMLFATGRDRGEFTFTVAPRQLAELAFAAIEGGMIVKRSLGRVDLVDSIAGTIEALLGAYRPLHPEFSQRQASPVSS